MNSGAPSRGCDCATITAYVVGAIGASLIMAVLVWVMLDHTQAAPLGADRAELRRKNLTEVKTANQEILSNYGWVDQGKGIARIPITEAMKIVEREWQDPKAARAKLLAREDKASAVAPAAPNPYE